MNIVSACCAAPIVTGSHTEYPLGGRTWGERFLVDVCGACGKEAEPVHSCGYCGTEIDGDNPEIRTTDGERCHICIGEVVLV